MALAPVKQVRQNTFEDMYHSVIRFTAVCGHERIASVDLRLKDRYSFKSLPRPVGLTMSPQNPTKLTIRAAVTTELQHRYVQVSGRCQCH